MTYDVPVFTLLLVGKVLDYRIFYPPWQTRYLNIDYMSNLGVYIPVIPHTGIIRCKYKNPSYEKQTSSGVWTFLLPFLQWKYSDQCIVWRKERSKNISMKFWANVLTLWETKILLKKINLFFTIIISIFLFRIYISRFTFLVATDLNFPLFCPYQNCSVFMYFIYWKNYGLLNIKRLI